MLVELTVASHAMHNFFFFLKNARMTLPQAIVSHYAKVSLPGHHWKSSYAPGSVQYNDLKLVWHNGHTVKTGANLGSKTFYSAEEFGLPGE